MDEVQYLLKSKDPSHVLNQPSPFNFYALKSLFITAISALLICLPVAYGGTEGIQTYAPGHKQKLADDISRYRNADNLWDVLRDQFTLQHYEYNPAVQEKIQWFMNNQDFLLRSATRAAPYLYYISQQVNKRHLPAELVLLPIVESGYNPFSMSNMGAVGIWQLMPETAAGLGVKRNSFYDGRRDVIASTRGALNYLAYLQSFFDGNWLLAIAAYNTGEGNVSTAIRRNVQNGYDTDFWSLPLSQQTKDYVPSLLALAVIISNPDKYPVYFPPVRNAPYLAQVDVDSKISLKYAAKLAGLTDRQISQLNPGFKKPAASAKGPYKLILPIENVAEFSENVARTPMSHQIDWIHYKVKSHDTLDKIAQKFDTTPDEIKKLNHLAKNELHRGLNLLIPNKSAATNENQALADNDDDDTAAPKISTRLKQQLTQPPENTLTFAEREAPEDTTPQIVYENQYGLQPGDTVYMVRKNDTLASIAKHFHTTQQALMAQNKLSSKKVSFGKQLIVPTHFATQQAASQQTGVAPGDTIYMVRSGDDIDKIAQRFHTTAAAIRLANLMANNALEEGEQIIVPTHMRG